MSIAQTVGKAIEFAELRAMAEHYGSREEWLLGRRSSVGASESPTLFGVGYASQSPVSIYESKASDRVEEFDAATAKRLRIGKQMEPVLRQIFADETGMEVYDAGEHSVYRHTEYPFISASLDGLCWNPEIEQVCVVELKNVHYFSRDEWEGDHPPLKYAVQVQHQLAVTGLERAYLLGLVGGQEPVVRTIERNERFIETALIPTIQRFWKHVESRTVPDVDASEATKRALQRLFEIEEDNEVFLPEEACAIDEELQSLKKEIKEKSEREDLLTNKLKALIGPAVRGLLTSGGSYSWKTTQRKGYTVEPTTVRILRRSK